MRTLSISFLSLTLTSLVIANAYYQKKQFYPSVVYITKSNPSMAVSKIKFIVVQVENYYCLLGNLYASFHLCLDKW